MANNWININKQLPEPYEVVEVVRYVGNGIGGAENYPTKYKGKGRLRPPGAMTRRLKAAKSPKYPSLGDWVFEYLDITEGFDILNGENNQPTHWRKII